MVSSETMVACRTHASRRRVGFAAAVVVLLMTPAAASQVTAAAPVPALSVSSPRVIEGDAGTTPAVFTLRLSAPARRTVFVRFGTSDASALGVPASATARRDYVPRRGMVVFRRGDRTKRIVIGVIGDQVPEDDETFDLVLRARNVRVARPRASARIVANDLPAPFAVKATLTGRSAGRGTFAATVDAERSEMAYTLTVSGLAADPTAVHIHPNTFGVKGPETTTLTPPPPRNGSIAGVARVSRIMILELNANPAAYHVMIHTRGPLGVGDDAELILGIFERG